MILIKKSWLHGVNGPEDIDPKPYIGKKFKVEDPRTKKEVVIVAEEILGNLANPTHFEIHSQGQSYVISMLDFFGQAQGHFFTKDEIKEFEKGFEGARVVPNSGWRPSWMQPRSKKIWTPR